MGPTQFALQTQDKQKQLIVAFCRGCCSENVKTFTKKLIALSVLNITVVSPPPHSHPRALLLHSCPLLKKSILLIALSVHTLFVHSLTQSVTSVCSRV
jgi:hypothetical protein